MKGMFEWEDERETPDTASFPVQILRQSLTSGQVDQNSARSALDIIATLTFQQEHTFIQGYKKCAGKHNQHFIIHLETLSNGLKELINESGKKEVLLLSFNQM